MKKLFAICLIASLITGCGRNYSNGSRTGVVTKLSHKGLIWDSWEGELLMALPANVGGAVQPEKFCFTVDPSCVYKVKAAQASGKRVSLVYRQWFLAPPSVDTQYIIVDVVSE